MLFSCSTSGNVSSCRNIGLKHNSIRLLQLSVLSYLLCCTFSSIYCSSLCCACCSQSPSTFSSLHSAWSRGRTGTSTSHRSCPACRGHGPCRRWWRALLDFRSPPPSCRIVKPSGGYRPRFCSRLRYFESYHTLEQIDYTFVVL